MSLPLAGEVSKYFKKDRTPKNDKILLSFHPLDTIFSTPKTSFKNQGGCQGRTRFEEDGNAVQSGEDTWTNNAL